LNGWFRLSADERKLLCENAGARLGIAAASVEKDFWVCWTLREMFALADWGPQLTFKCGTSLSKAWKLIDRFSEDVDVTIERMFAAVGSARNSCPPCVNASQGR
jgi:predicted nucleotidyltransferase component of viral defense system